MRFGTTLWTEMASTYWTCLKLQRGSNYLKGVGPRKFHSSSRCFSRDSFSGRDAYVSKHFEVPNGELEEFLDRKGLSCDAGPEYYTLHSCPQYVCKNRDHGDSGKHSNVVMISRVSGSYHCIKCACHGSWFNFMAAVEGRVLPIATAEQIFSKTSQNSQTKQEPDGSLDRYAESLQLSKEVLDWLTIERKIQLETLLFYKVGAGSFNFPTRGGMHLCVTFPWFSGAPPEGGADSAAAVPVRIKVRSVRDKACMRLVPSGGGWGFFGWNTLRAEHTEVVLTEGELDAMSVYQETGRPAISLPNGARSLPPQLVEMLERFETPEPSFPGHGEAATHIYLWLDDDVPGQQGAQDFIKKLGRHRCRIVRTRAGRSCGPKDANDALRARLVALEARSAAAAGTTSAVGDDGDVHSESAGEVAGGLAVDEEIPDLRRLLAEAPMVRHDSVLSFQDLRDDVRRMLTDPTKGAGVVAREGCSLPTLGTILKGHRRGELTVLTGRTGQGKTTLVSQVSLDLAEANVCTLWGSFEVGNVRLASRMLQQHARRSLEGADDEVFKKHADSFGALPIFFLAYYGGTKLDAVLEAMEYAVYVHDVTHVIIDNLQFMTSGMGRGNEIFSMMDHAIHRLRDFATSKNVHITVVVHPRKEDEGQLLSLSSVFGSAKATQEADNVIILQDNGLYKFLDVRKNRYDGQLGTLALRFDRKCFRYSEMKEEDVERLEQEAQFAI